MLQPVCGLHRAILLEPNHRSLLPWVEKYVVRDVHAVSAVGRARVASAIEIVVGRI